MRGTRLAVFLALVHTFNDAITAILGALLPTLQERFDAEPTLLALIVVVTRAETDDAGQTLRPLPVRFGLFRSINAHLVEN